ncbi:hypothetical protein ABW16_22705 [Mycolicibacter heraklionensis]|uniref:DUF732 domain-containing protein n=2 Tax=Mycolicibacter heraklionensis TaxID=512402 RepID=A0A9X7ZGD5_9MYCO|nr:hypothetical protein ABW16_22705 [Mycolicibacter heraklionensis]QZA09891.1 DUF732 domain-containing protein [Mycolicibacter heraklionensis]
MPGKLAVTAFAVAGLLGMATPAAADPGDGNFLGALDKMGISYPDPADAVAGGHSVCDYLTSGHSANQAAKAVKNANPSLTLTRASQFVSIARASYCEEA